MRLLWGFGLGLMRKGGTNRHQGKLVETKMDLKEVDIKTLDTCQVTTAAQRLIKARVSGQLGRC